MDNAFSQGKGFQTYGKGAHGHRRDIDPTVEFLTIILIICSTAGVVTIIAKRCAAKSNQAPRPRIRHKRGGGDSTGTTTNTNEDESTPDLPPPYTPSEPPPYTEQPTITSGYTTVFMLPVPTMAPTDPTILNETSYGLAVPTMISTDPTIVNETRYGLTSPTMMPGDQTTVNTVNETTYGITTPTIMPTDHTRDTTSTFDATPPTRGV